MASPIQELTKGKQVDYNVQQWLHHCAKEGAVGFQFVDIPEEIGGCSKKDIGQPFKYMPKKKLGSLFNLADYAAVYNVLGSSESSFGEDEEGSHGKGDEGDAHFNVTDIGNITIY